jgi:ribose/xylose/arabinose/galactoside ABC-type transport system permease subunit
MNEAVEGQRQTPGGRTRARLKLPESWILIVVIIAMCLGIGIIEPVFFSFENVVNIIISISVISIVGVGMTMVILTGGIDVSVGGILALSATIAGSMLKNPAIPVFIPVVVALLVGLVFGAFNGFCTAILRIPALIVTLATVSITRGLVLIYTRGQASYGFPKSFLVLGQGRFLGIPIVVYLTIILLAIGMFVLNRTTFGRRIYAVGNNQIASRVVGIRVKSVFISIFAITGVLCAIAGLTTISRMNAAPAILAEGLEFQVITAVVIGGTSILGGRGSIGKTIIGAVIVGLILNGLQLIGVSVYYNQFLSGLILLVAVILDMLRQRKTLH